MYTKAFAVAMICLPGLAMADGVGITPDMMAASVPTATGMVEISRNQDTAHRLEGDWTLTSRPCPNFCITEPFGPKYEVLDISQ